MKTAAQDTDQIRTWTGNFGQEYTDRNDYSPTTLDEAYQQIYGVTRRALNQEFLQGVPKDARILEVGCNMGTQLLSLREMGFTNLYGIEIQSYALERAKARLGDANLDLASAFAIPYPDQHFDLVFTSGVLIHIAPSDLPAAMDEIYRCTKQWIWGLEYYAPEMTEINYRGHRNLLWKTDYARAYLERFKDLDLTRERRLPYLESKNLDSMFLLRRRQ